MNGSDKKDLEDGVEKVIKESDKRKKESMREAPIEPTEKKTSPPVKKNRMKHVGVVLLLVVIAVSMIWMAWSSIVPDTDGDGYNDDVDAFPDDPNEWKDSDNDGVGDNSDKFKYDSTQWTDRDGDGYGDNPNGNDPDVFPDDPNEWKDSDNDGIGDNSDAFLNDPGEWKDSDNDGVGDNGDAFPNNPNEQYDSDEDGIGNNADAFPYDSTQWTDRDDDGYGDNPNGNNPDAFPNDATEWKDSDSDGIGDNADIYDDGNGGIKVAITKYQGDYYGDEWGETDPYFTICISTYNDGTGEWEDIDCKTSIVYDNTNSVSHPVSLIVDVNDDVQCIRVMISAMDYDVWSSDDQIDLNGDSGSRILYTYFYPRQKSYDTFTADGRLDLLDEMDGYIEYYIKVVGI